MTRDGKLVDWKKYCYSKKYKSAYEKDNADNEARIAMARLGYMELMMGKYEYDGNGKNVVNKIQFRFYRQNKLPVLMFDNWKQVRVFLEGERTTYGILRH